jgi:mercuric transport protein
MMIKSMLVSLMGAGAVGAFAICDLCQSPADLAAGASVVAAAEAAPAPARAIELEKVTFRVEGMTCGGCAIAARTVLQRLEGVEKAEVSYEESRAVVTYDPEKVTIEEMIAAIKELGYTATVVEPENA